MCLRITLPILMVLSLISSTAQQDLMLYNLPNVAQSIYVNPAHAPHDGIHIGLPFLSSTSLQHSNSTFNPAKLFENVEGRVEFRTEAFLDNIREKNNLGLEMSSDLFSIGLPIKGHYFSFAIRDRLSAGLVLPGDMLRFPFIGNGDFDATDGILDFSNLAIDLNHFTEYGFGWSMTLKDRFYIGARTKILFGKENISTADNTIQWITDPVDYTWTVEGDVMVQSSGVDNLLDSIDGNALLENGRIGKYMFGSSNTGLGVDLGFGMQMNERLDWGISVVDLGYIRWKEDNRNFTGVGAEFGFAGIEITEAFVQEGGSFS
ncbi:MAG: hypothetical protein HKN79_12380, partial [Flavobacteriales bacterium]|nr:hypothetical protein [Flavobacteriales bacterium]